MTQLDDGRLIAFGEIKSVNAWANDSRCKVSRKGLRVRLAANWDTEAALTTPPKTAGSSVGRKGKVVTAFGETKSVNAWSEDVRCQVSRTMLRNRLADGMLPEDALTGAPTRSQTFGPREAFGEAKRLVDWVKDPRCVVKYGTVVLRMSQGVCLEEALTTPVPEATKYEGLNESKSLKAWALDKRCKVSQGLLTKRIEAGMGLVEALTLASPYGIEHKGFGESKSIYAWSVDPRCVVSYETLQARLEGGQDVETAIVEEVPLPTQYEAFGEIKSLGEWMLDDRCVPEHFSTVWSRFHKMGVSLEEALQAASMTHVSSFERKIKEYLDSLGVSSEQHNRKLIAPRELDFWIPDRGLAIECNGLYWHSEQIVSPRFHYEKWKECADKGIQLVHIWEDELRDRPHVVFRMIRHKLGLSTQRLGARKTKVVEVPWQDAKPFLDFNHIQGSKTATLHLGLTYEDDLVAVCSFSRTGDVWDLNRYATSVSVQGGFTKILNHFCKTQEWKQIVTFADHGVSDGGLYERSGFRLDREIPIDYSYVVGGCRAHKFGYRLDRFKTDPKLKYVEGMTERQLADLNGIPRIWDAGKARYVLD